ncbi:MAG TPA: hypothetical protein VNN22_09265 [Verrucomicrobiae bacterium]|nr:hypothetical protein [Verrucomicrobiae bacterium]
MSSRVLFIFFAAFWITMNGLLWYVEYGSRGSGVSVPVDLVWRKILTAPDASSMNIYEDGERSGFCEFSTSVEMEMAKLDEDKPPPEGIIARAGYSIHLNGNTSLGDFTNRVRFDARLQFSAKRQWRELSMKISSHYAVLEIHSLATNQTVHVKITGDEGTIERDLAFDELRNPNTVLRVFAGNFGGGLIGMLDLPVLPPAAAETAQNLHWEAHRARLKIGREPVSAYRLETSVLGRPILIYVSTLGEILRVELPNGITATLDEWSKL